MIRVDLFSIGVFISCISVAGVSLAQGTGSAPPPTGAPVAQPAPPPPAAVQPYPYPPPPAAAPPPPAAVAPNEQWRYVPAPMELRYVEGRPIPPGYHHETRPRRGLVIAGPIVFGVPYVLSMSVAASSRYEPDRWLYAPVVGPFIDLAQRGDDCTRSTVVTGPGTTSTFETCSEDSSTRFFLMFDGLMQTAGATMLILGLALPQHVLVRDDAPYTGSTGSRFSWAVAPQRLGRSGYGIGLNGTF
jgi:hypothetical protein